MLPDVVYQQVARNGKTYRVTGPAGLSAAEISASIRRQDPTANQLPARPTASRQDAEFNRGRQATAATRAVPNVLRQVADVAGTLNPFVRMTADRMGIGPSDERMDATSAFTQGVVGLGGAVASAVDADSGAAQMFDRMGRRARGRRSDAGLEAEARGAQRREAAEGNLLNEIGAGVLSVFDDPVGSIGSGAGSLVAAVPALAGAVYGGVPAAIGTGLTVGLGIAAGAGGVKKSIYDAVRSELVASGTSEEDAEEIAHEAQAYGGDNTGSIALGAILGLIASKTGIEGPAMRVIGQKIAGKLGVELAERTAARGMVSNFVRETGVEGITEGAQGGQEQLAANLALRNEGFDTPVWEGVASQAAMEGTIGAILGGGAGAISDAAAGPSAARVAENAAEDARLAENADSPYEVEVRRLEEYGLAREEAEQTAQVRGFAPVVAPAEPEAEDASVDDRRAGRARVRSVDQGAPVGGTPGTVAPPAAGGVGTAGSPVAEPVPVEGGGDPALTEPVVRPRGKKAALPVEPEVAPAEPTAAPPTLPENVAQTIYDMGESKMPDMGSEQNAAALTGLRQSLGMEPRFAPEVVATFKPDILQAYRAGETAGTTGISIYTDFLAKEEAPVAKAKKPKAEPLPVPDVATDPVELPAIEAAPVVATPKGKKPKAVQTAEQEFTPFEYTAEAAAKDALYLAGDKKLTKVQTPPFVRGYIDAAAGVEPAAKDARTPMYKKGRAEAETYLASRAAPVAEVAPAPEAPAPAVEAEAAPAPVAEVAPAEAQAQARLAEKNAADIEALDAIGADVRSLRSVVDSKDYVAPPATVARLIEEAKAKHQKEQEKNAAYLAESDADRARAAAMTTKAALKAVNTGKLKPYDLTPEQLAAYNDSNKNTTRRKEGEAVSAPLPRQEVEAAVAETTRGWVNAPKITVVETSAEVPGNDGTAIRGEWQPDGVYIVADTHASAAEVQATVFHETLGHAGLRQEFGDEFARLLQDVVSTNPARAKAAEAWEKANPESFAEHKPAARRRGALEEVLAEASEGGRQKLPAFTRTMAAIKDFLRRWTKKLFGKTIAYSDNDVLAIMQRAHDNITKGGSNDVSMFAPQDSRQARAPKKPTASATAPAATPTAAGKKAKVAAKKSDAAVRKLQLSAGLKDTGDIADLLAGTVDARNFSDWEPALKDVWSNLSIPTQQGLLTVMPTSGIVDWIKDKIPPLARIEVLAQQRAGQLQAYINGFGKISGRMVKFANRHGNHVLSTTLHLSRIKRVDPAAFGATEAASIAADPIVKHIDALQKNKQKKLQPGTVRWLKGERTKRENDVRVVYKAWTSLGKQKGGQDAYREQVQFHLDMLAALRAANDAFIRNMGLEPKAEARMLKVVREPADGATGAAELIPDELYPHVYVPFRRYGKHWLRVAAEAGSNERELYMFEKAGDRDAKMRERAKALGLDLDDAADSARFDVGDSLAELQKNTHAESALLKTMFDAIDSVIVDGAGTVNPKELEALKDRLFQTYLMSQPERSLRKAFIHTDNVTGMDPDIIRTFNNSAVQFATQLTNGKYRTKMRRGLEEARAYISGQPVKERARLKLFIDEMEARVESDYSEALDNEIVNAINRVAFAYFLTGAGTAIAQWTAIPIRVMPRLTTDYGYGKATAILTKYMALPASVGVTNTNPDGSTSWTMPTFGSSAITRGRKIMSRAFKALEARAAFETAADAVLHLGKTPHGTEKAIKQITRGSAEIMGAAFKASERMSREMVAMMAFELEYNKNGDFDAAVDKAVKVTNDTLGNYLEMERPPLAKGPIARSIFMFKQYSLTQTRFFIGAPYTIMRGIKRSLDKGNYTKAERKAALRDARKATHELAGVTLMAAMFAGVPGLFAFSQFVIVVQALLNMFGDEEDKEDARGENPYMNPYDDLDGWFWQVFMRRNFGEPTVEGPDGKMHSLAGMLEFGPVSELTDMNIGSRTSFDDLWFREGAPAETTDEYVMNALAANVPPVSMILNTARAYDDFKGGHVLRGLSKLAPAFFGGPIRSAILDKQGVETRKGDTVVGREFITESNIWAQRLGFAPTGATDVQRDRFAYLRAEMAAAKSMSEATERLYRAATDEQRGEGDVENAYRIIDRHNKRYPSGQFTITDETLERSFKSRASADARTYGGILVNEKDIPYYNAIFGYDQ